MAVSDRTKNGLSLFSGVKRVEGLSTEDVQQALGAIIKQKDSVDKLMAIRPGSEAEHAQTVLMECTATVSDIIRPVENELSALTEDNPASSIRLS